MVADFLVTGASGYTGRRLVRHLAGQGRDLRLLLRPTSDTAWLAGAAVEVVTADLEDAAGVRDAIADVRCVLHLAHIRYAGVIAAALGQRTERVVFVSSLRIVSRVPCPSVAEVAAGEAVAQQTPGAVILRPSMIYGPGDDRNLSRLAHWLRRRRWLPVIGAEHLHQPVHVDDVVQAITAAADTGVAGTFAIAGPAPLTYTALVGAVAAAVGVQPRLIHLPPAPLVAGLGLWLSLGLPAPVRVAQIRRLLEDKVYDITPARRHLHFDPRPLPQGVAQCLAALELESPV